MTGALELIAASLHQRLVEAPVPSLAVAVARQGEILWEAAFGWADREARVPATPHTLYSLASISKPITATALMLLVERGLVELEAPANDYLGDAPLTAHVGDAAEATVRRVANHTAGLPLHYHFFPEDEPARRPPFEATLARYGHLVTAPGERYQYANLGYGILDHVIARVSGMSYAEFLRRELFLPLGMLRACVDVAPGLEPYAAVRYHPESGRLPFYDFDHPGASAVYCSAHDLARFGSFHLKRRLPDQKALLSDACLDAMQLPTAECGPGTGYGIGWRIDDSVPGFPRVGHSGGMAGVNTTLELHPDTGLAITVLANTSTELPFRVAEEIAAALLPGFGEALAEQKEKKERQEQEKAAGKADPLRPGPELLGEWSGAVHTYRGEVPLTIRFLESGDVHARAGSGLTTLVNDACREDGRLKGRMFGDIGTEDAARRPYHLHLDLKLRGQVLNGAVTAISLPSGRPGNALSHWSELRRCERGTRNSE